MAVAGTIVATKVEHHAGILHSLKWTSDAAGVVSDIPVDVGRGVLRQAMLEPDTGGTAPTTLYDMTLDGVGKYDLLAGAGANVPVPNVKLVNPTALPFVAGPVTPMITNAGASKGGTIHLLISKQY